VNNKDGLAKEKGRPLLHPACPSPSSRIKDATRRFAVPKRASLTRLAVAVLVKLQGRDEEQGLPVRTRNMDSQQRDRIANLHFCVCGYTVIRVALFHHWQKGRP